MDIRKRSSKKQEDRVAKELSGRVTPASGALWGAKGDVRNDVFLVECKTTGERFYTLTFNTWDKIYREAIKDGLRIPVMCIDLENGGKRFAVMCSKDIPKELTVELTELHNNSLSFRVQHEQRHLISKGEKCYDLSVIDWNTFLDEVVGTYN